MSIIEAAQYTRRIETPPEIANGANGEPAYIEIRTRFKNKYRDLFLALTALAGKVKDIDEDKLKGDDEAEINKALELVAEFGAAQAETKTAYAYFILSWNWLDAETCEPLPPPDTPGVFGELYDHQVDWLQKQIDELLRHRTTEGNASTPTP